MKNTIYVSLHGGPGSRKSTMMASLFAELKWRGYDAEMAPEYVKELVWEGQKDEDLKLKQTEIFNEQLNRLERLKEKVDIVITDSPVLLTLAYTPNISENHRKKIVHEHKTHSSIDIFVLRKAKYNPNGRYQTEEEAKTKDKEIKQILVKSNVSFYQFEGTKESVDKIVDVILEHYERIVKHDN